MRIVPQRCWNRHRKPDKTVVIEAFLAVAGDSDTGAGHRYSVGSRTTIGRGDDNDIIFVLSGVSRAHAMIEHRPDGYWLVDLTSRNGTFLNGERVGDDAVRLVDSDRVVLGSAVDLIFRDPMATPIAPLIGRLTGLWIDKDTDAVWIDARRVEPPLSSRQLRLLRKLYDAEGEIISRADLVDHVWDDAAAEGVSDDALAALIKRLRSRLASFESDITHVEIIRSRGLRLKNAW